MMAKSVNISTKQDLFDVEKNNNKNRVAKNRGEISVTYLSHVCVCACGVYVCVVLTENRSYAYSSVPSIASILRQRSTPH